MTSEDSMQSVSSWSDLPLSPEMLEMIENAGYQSPTPVQGQSIPLIMQGNDVLVSSQTGSGKTASFVIPIVEKFKGKNGTYILALAPTREIAQQTGAVFETFGAPYGLKTVVCIGGASIPQEKEALASSPHIIVATPGRLCDHLERGNVWLDFIQCLIFDEADHILEMGFAKQIDTITEQIPKERQTLMFSATYAPNVEKLARKAMRNPKEVTIAKTSSTAPKIDQHLFWINEDKKLSTLMRLLKEDPGTFFVFVKAKERAYQIWRSLHHNRFEDVTYIHSDLPQEAREAAVADFKAGKFRVIIATDVMGRGIDVDDVAHVVNYDVPREAADYVHRIGRTGRRGKTGNASTFAIPGKDDQAIRAIAKLRGVESPTPPQKDQEPRSKRGKSAPSEKRPPRETRGRDGRPRQERPRGERPQHPRGKNDRPQVHSSPVEKQVQTPVPPKKSGGLVSWFKRLFK